MPSSDPHSSSAPIGSQGAEPPWEIIAERIDAYSAAWDQALAAQDGALPWPDAFIAGLDDRVARLALLELVKIDVERRWQHELTPIAVEQYARDLPQLGPVERLPAELIYEELRARVLAGRAIHQEEINQRFPAQAASLLRLLGSAAISGSPTETVGVDTVRGTEQPTAGGKATPPPALASASFAHLKPGDQIDDFQLIAPLGSGAFARVFLARQVSMERMVALKVSAAVGSEPQTLAQLDHPNIVRVYDQRSCTDPRARLLYMEVVPGGTLQDAIMRMRDAISAHPDGMLLLTSIDERLSAVGAPRPESSASRDWIDDASWPDIVARLGAEMSEGLAYAHARGVLHRDIKPANVMLSAEGKPKLVDFNVSYNGGRADEDPTKTFGGSLAYMSPEQLEACHPTLGGSPRNVRTASDLYAIGIMLWELLTGRRPFRDEQASGAGGHLARLQRMIDMRRYVDLNKLAEALPKSCPASLRAVLIKCLQPSPAERYRDAGELARALRLCLNPRCWSLLEPPRAWLGRFVLRRPVLSLVVAGLAPNIATAAFNFRYNQLRIQATNRDELIARFAEVQLWINILAFSIGIGIGTWVALRAFRLLKQQEAKSDPKTSTDILLFGRFVTQLVLVLWTVSGIAFPVAIGWGLLIDNAPGFYIHFFLSLAICGFAATSYPYFLDTAMSVHYFVPQLVRNGAIVGPRRTDLKRILRLNRLFLALSALVPLLGVLLLTAFSETPQDQRGALLTVSGGGLIGFGAMMWLERLITLDVAALDHIAVDEPRGQAGGSSNRGRRST